MRSHLRSIFLCVVALFAVGTVAAQVQTPAELNIPWNGYTPQRIPNGFSTIVGQSGTTLITVGDDQTSQITLPFVFRFMDIDVGPGTSYPNIWVVDNGYIMFNNPNGGATYAPQLNYTTSGPYSRVIIGWWNDMVTAGGGIYYRTDGSPGGRTFTVEWRVGTWPSGGNPGNVQVKIFENGRIEWHYSSAPPNSGASTTVAMMTGLKYYGQPVGNPTGVSDATYYMLFNNPNLAPTQVAVTKLRTDW